MSPERFPIRSHGDIVLVRKAVKGVAVKIGFGPIDQVKITTAASELARNTLEYGLGGDMELWVLENEKGRPGIQLIFVDQGPGIVDLKLALTDGFTSGHGLGMGLPGSKRLMNDFSIQSEIGKGTRVAVAKWK
ncbi:MAG: anti-sigma regulatory factor [Bdellovibrionales bacterium]|nr:anti-sigma regulatory factor [Bdellovibrionales bacterium]